MSDSLRSKTSVIFCSAKESPSCFLFSQKVIGALTEVDMKVGVSFAEAQGILFSGKKAILIISIPDKEALANTTSFIVSFKDQIKDKKIIPIIFMRHPSEKVEELFIKAGCNEVLRYDLQPKAFVHKIRRFIALIDQNKNAGPESTEVFDRKSVSGGTSAQFYKIELYSPRPSDADFWLFRKRTYAKRFKGKWLIEVIGPSPAAGSWQKISTPFANADFKADTRQELWEWVAREGATPFKTDPEKWIFQGKKPDYSWSMNRWAFVSEIPALVLLENGNASAKLISSAFLMAGPNLLRISGNPPASEQFFDEIKRTYHADYIYQEAKLDSKELALTLETQEALPWADRINSIDLSSKDWNTHDLSKDASKEWGVGEGVEETREWSKDPVENPVFYDFAMGAEAMNQSGVFASIKDWDVELLGYSSEQRSISVGAPRALLEKNEEIEVNVTSKNFNIPASFSLRGKIAAILEDFETDRCEFTMDVLSESEREFSVFKDALEQRQNEVFAFFKQVKGH